MYDPLLRLSCAKSCGELSPSFSLGEENEVCGDIPRRRDRGVSSALAGDKGDCSRCVREVPEGEGRCENLLLYGVLDFVSIEEGIRLAFGVVLLDWGEDMGLVRGCDCRLLERATAILDCTLSAGPLAVNFEIVSIGRLVHMANDLHGHTQISKSEIPPHMQIERCHRATKAFFLTLMRKQDVNK